jgi:hypothetical protein
MKQTKTCELCRIELTDKNLGYEVKEGLICSECYKMELERLIQNVGRFIKSDSFNIRQNLIKKKLWLSEEMGYWHDIQGPNVQIQESVADYTELPTSQIQDMLKSELLTLKDSLKKEKQGVEE